MKSISRAQAKERERIAKELDQRQDELQGVVNQYNAELEQWRERFRVACESLSDTVSEANGWIEEVAGDVLSFMDDHEEAWLEGDKGCEYQEWLSELQQEIDPIEVELPDDLEIDEDLCEEFENVRTAIEST